MTVRFWLSGALIFSMAALTSCSEQKKPAPPPQPAASAEPAKPPGGPAHVADTVIREGRGVGGIELGMTVAEVRSILGEPNSQNLAGDSVVFMSYHPSQIFGVYFDDNHRVRMIIAALQSKTWCTEFDVCLYREGDLPKLVAHHGDKLLRFVDRDETVTYRQLSDLNGKQVMTEYTPNDAHKAVIQVAILYWNGKIDTSGFD